MAKRSATSWEATTRSLAQTLAVGRAIGALAQAGDVVALDGELGAGKTQLVRGMAEGMGIDPRAVSSPTFVVMQEYEPDETDKPVLIHIDAYRLNGVGDLASVGWEEAGGELAGGAVLAIEWPTRLGATLGDHVLAVEIEHAGDVARRLRITPRGAWVERMDRLMDETGRALFE